jgi:predicted nucleotidyltransferase
MRLNKNQIEIIKDTVKNKIGECDIYIFGSRLKDNLKGGDVDIFIDKKLNLKEKTELKIILEEKLFLPVDIISFKDSNRLIEKEAKKGIKI